MLQSPRPPAAPAALGPTPRPRPTCPLTTVPCCERPLCYSRPARLLRLLRWALPLGLVLLALLSLLCHAVSAPCVTVAPPACCACCAGPYPSASSYLPSSGSLSPRASTSASVCIPSCATSAARHPRRATTGGQRSSPM